MYVATGMAAAAAIWAPAQNMPWEKQEKAL